MDVHEALVGVQRAEAGRLRHERGALVDALGVVHPRVIERGPGAIEVRARVEDGEVARITVARRLHRAHGDAAGQPGDDERERHDGDGQAEHRMSHRARSRARA